MEFHLSREHLGATAHVYSLPVFVLIHTVGVRHSLRVALCYVISARLSVSWSFILFYLSSLH